MWGYRKKSKLYEHKQLYINLPFDSPKKWFLQLFSTSFHILDKLYDRLIIVIIDTCDKVVIHQLISN